MGSGTSSGGEGPGGVNGDTLDNMKSSPATAPTTPREGENNMDFNMPNFPQGGENVSLIIIIKDLKPDYYSLQNESAAILKIKESMQEEAKRFEKDSDGPSDYYGMP